MLVESGSCVHQMVFVVLRPHKWSIFANMQFLMVWNCCYLC